MTSKIITSAIFFLSLLKPFSLHAQKDASLWLTNPDRSALLQLQTPAIPLTNAPAANQIIEVDDRKTYQTMDGFGFALTGGTAQLLMHMEAANRAALLHELFAADGEGIGVSYLRLTVGSSDMNDHVYSYDDLPEGKTDRELAKFSLAPDQLDVIPLVKEILEIAPNVKFLASPWSAPLWMKTTGVARGGVLKPEYFGAYADYLVKYVEGMHENGISIDTLTIQNEPLNEKNTPSMLMLESEQADFIKNALGPAFKKAGVKTKIVLYDHNLDHPSYPLSILRDPEANKYIDGTGFHLYGGTVDAMSQVHDAFPKKNLYFTEQSITDPNSSIVMKISQPVSWVIVGVSRNWAKNILLWNLAADSSLGPHTNDGGCTDCQGALTIDGDKVTRNLAFYTVAHASKFIPPGSTRIGSNNLASLANVAFKTPNGKRVLIVANTSESLQQFSVRSGEKYFSTSLGPGSVGTFVW